MTHFLAVGLFISLAMNFYMLFEFHTTKTQMEHMNSLVMTDSKGMSLLQRIQNSQNNIHLLENNLKEINAQFPDIRENMNTIHDHVKTLEQKQEQESSKLKKICINNELKDCNS